ncbi:hypothetical protein T4E_9874 [Trichinella pseudospiralis]|uniref:Uncharacterized protein n=1 Tax=Trichinella pseudospiralis TaxID=6337 RepID=A0A0V0XW37_TRIPS|nr:hypothetical protein T4E_9874 [Trichinella pseudospiralis]
MQSLVNGLTFLQRFEIYFDVDRNCSVQSTTPPTTVNDIITTNNIADSFLVDWREKTQTDAPSITNSPVNRRSTADADYCPS